MARTRAQSLLKSRSKIRAPARPKKAAAAQSTTADATVAALAAHGIDTIYALPGVHSDDFFDALARNAGIIRTVHPRHEQGAAYMALGASLVRGDIAVCNVVPGPGVLNAAADASLLPR